MSEKWKAEKAAQRKLAQVSGEATEVVDSSDDEVIIEEHQTPNPKVAAKGKKGRESAASQSSSKTKADRLR